MPTDTELPAPDDEPAPPATLDEPEKPQNEIAPGSGADGALPKVG